MRLKRLLLEDFRAIRGAHAVPLDAGVVLVHGANGAGKSSFVAALELALTGEIRTLAGAQENAKDLVHIDAGFAGVHLVAEVHPEEEIRSEYRIENGQVRGTPLLRGPASTKVAERCFFSQSVLMRLLEVYQPEHRNADEAMIAFVGDLLGLGELDALSDGLKSASDVRRMRRDIDGYAWVENAAHDSEALAREATAGVDSLRAELAELVRELGLDGPDVDDVDLARLHMEIERSAREADLRSQRVATLGFELSAIVGQLGSEQRAARPQDAAAAASEEQYLAWSSTEGARLLELVVAASRFLGMTPPPDPGMALNSFGAVQDLLVVEQRSISDRFDAHLEAEGRADAARSGRQVESDRLAALNDAGDGDRDDAELRQVLADLLVHLDGEDCPVCGRDFGELRKGSLAAHLSGRLSSLSRQIEQRRELRQARAASVSAMREHEEALSVAQTAMLEPEVLADLEARRLVAGEHQRVLESLLP
ncbi:MAG TPA: AAA family ATPase, partial [Iamia sp.]|nr:AAA family ATPase [Iamia sp.]